MEAASIAHAEHHCPPPAHRSSRAEPATLGMLLSIISEVLIFGAFFTAYSFIPVLTKDPWAAHATTLPVAVPVINPLRSEAGAFRVRVWFVAAVAVIAVIVLVVQALT